MTEYPNPPRSDEPSRESSSPTGAPMRSSATSTTPAPTKRDLNAQPAPVGDKPAALAGLLVVRLLLALMFLFSGLAKIGVLGSYGNTPKEFAAGIHKFKLLDYELIADAAFVIPWIEIVCGAALLLGLASRGAAYLANLLVLAFTAGILLVIARGIKVENCACFGGRLQENFGMIGSFIEPPVGWTSVLRNVVLIALGLVIVKRGSGYLAVDRMFNRSRRT